AVPLGVAMRKPHPGLDILGLAICRWAIQAGLYTTTGLGHWVASCLATSWLTWVGPGELGLRDSRGQAVCESRPQKRYSACRTLCQPCYMAARMLYWHWR